MHEEKVCASLMSKDVADYLVSFKRILTDAYLYDPQVIFDATNFISQIFDYVRAHNILLTPDVDLILDLTPNEDGNTVCGYYFASHTNRCVFWLDRFVANDFPAWREVGGATSPSHLRTRLYSMNSLCGFDSLSFRTRTRGTILVRPADTVRFSPFLLIIFYLPITFGLPQVVSWNLTWMHRYHCELFPIVCEMSVDVVDELRDIIMHNMGGQFNS